MGNRFPKTTRQSNIAIFSDGGATMIVNMKTAISLLVVLLTTATVSAQSHHASVRGVVLDPSSAPIPQVTLQIANEATGESRTTVTGADGRFVIALLPAGTYRIDIEQPGYKRYVSRLALQINQELWLDVPLALGNVSDEV